MRSAVMKVFGVVLGSAALLTACGGGGGGGGDDPPVTDTTPAAFTFVDQTGVTAATTMTSSAVTITGINAPAPVTVAGGSYSISGTGYVTSAGTVSNGDTVRVRHTSSATPSTATNTTLTVGGVSDVFTTTTAGGGADTTPAAFSFTDQAGVAASTVVTSAPVTITGINAPSAVTVAGGTYSVGCTATYVATAGTVTNNQTVCARHTSSAAAGTATNTTLTVGGVSDVFTSTTAGAVPPKVSLLPFLTGAGAVRLFDPTVAASGSNPVTVDTGLAPPPAGVVCYDCFRQAETFFTATIAGSAVSNLHASRLAYAKRAGGNDSGGMMYKLDITKGAASNAPVQISSRTDACRIVRSETTDFADIDNTAVVIERAGADLSCSASADNVATVIRLNSAATDAGTVLPLALDTGNPLHARTSATGAVTGYVSFEVAGVDSFLLVRRDANLANPVTLQTLGQLTGANLERADFTHLYVTATPVEQSMKLYRVETNGSLSAVLHSFDGFNAGNPIQDGLRDATHLYFTDENRLLRIPVGSTSENATVLTTLACATAETCLRIENRALDSASGHVVFEAQDGSITVAGGVFSAATTATDDPAIVLANNGDGLGGFAVLALAADGRAYINIAHHGGDPTHVDALQVATGGTGAVTIASAYWAGRTRATAFDVAAGSTVPTESIFLARHAEAEGVGTDTVSAVAPASGAEGVVLGKVNGISVFMAVNVDGLGRYALARVEKDRFGALDYDVYRVDAQAAANAGTLPSLVQTDGGTDIPLDSLQRLTGNLCLLCL